MIEKKVQYEIDGVVCNGHAFFPESREKLPCVIIAHAWMGQDEFARDKARQMAKLGYVGFAADIYGHGTTAQTKERAAELMMPLFLDRELLQKRLIGALEAVKNLAEVDSQRVAAIGFCFGGLSVIELVRSGADLKGAVSIHGVVSNAMGSHKAKTVPLAETPKAKLLIMHGHDDPLVTQADLTAIETELTEGGVDWQLHIFSHTAHAFTNPESQDKSMGLIFNEKANRRTWPIVECFLNEIFTA